MPLSSPAAATRAAPVAIVVLAAAISVALAFAPQLFNDGDTYWHLAAGKLIVASFGVPSVDPFSFTMRGQPWTAHEWLAEVASAVAYRLGGWSGVASLHAVAVGVAVYLVGQWNARFLPLRHVVLVVTLLMLVLAPFVLARPHVVAWPLLAGFLLVLLQARTNGRAPSLWGVAIMVMWANVHASFALGLALAAAFALEALIERGHRLRVIQQWGLYGLALLLAALATPHGMEGLLFPLQVSGMDMVDTIAEWRASSWPKDWAFFAVALAACVGAALRWHALGPVRLLVLGGLLAMAVQHSRHQAPFALTAALLFAPAMGAIRPPPTRRQSAHWAVVPGLLAVVAMRQIVPLVPPETASVPRVAITAIPSALRGQHGLNSYGFGGPLIFAGMRPYIDGRVDMYGDAFLREHQRMMKGDMGAFRSAAKHYNLAWTIISPREPLAVRLDQEPGWRRIYADRRAVIHIRGN